MSMKTLKEYNQIFCGFSLDYASRRAAQDGLLFRVTSVDGERCIGTCDFRTDRVNVKVEKGIIVEVASIG